MTITALIQMKGNYDEPVVRKLEILPYGMSVYDPDGTPDEALTLHLMGLCSHALEHGLVTVEELAAFGDERPEGYIYAYGVLKHFAFTPDAPKVDYPNHELFTLYPADDTYRRIDTLN